MPKLKAILYRMMSDKSTCPFGIRAKALLKKEGYTVEDHHLKTPKEVEAIKKKYGVQTTPQIVLQGEHIGGYDDVRAYFGKKPSPKTSYRPVLFIFLIALLLTVVLELREIPSGLHAMIWLMNFVAFSMVILGVQKVRDIDAFANQFITYDLLGQRWLTYAYLYPVLEIAAGLIMLQGKYLFISAMISFVIGAIGFLSVFKAVYIDKRELKCACVGGQSKVPLGFLSLTENIMMLCIALYIFIA